MIEPSPASMSDLELRLRGYSQYRAVAYAYGRADEMEQPAVQYLRYDLTINGLPVDQSLLPSEACSAAGFDLEFKNGQLEARPQEAMPRWTDAEKQLQPYLRDWEALSELGGSGVLRFTLRHFAVGNQASNPRGPMNCVASLSDWTWQSPPGEKQPTRLAPPPGPGWHSDDLLELLRIRWREVLAYRASPLVEGNFLLTAVEKRFGGRKEAAVALGIPRKQLVLLATICLADDPLRGRKSGASEKTDSPRSRTGPMTAREGEWLVAFAQEIMLRLASIPRRAQPFPTAQLPSLDD